MSLYPEFKESVSVYHPVNANGKTAYPTLAFTDTLTIMALSAEDRLVMGDIYGEYKCNAVRSDYQKGDKIVGTKTYFVTNTPEYNHSFKRYKLQLQADKR